MLLGYKRMMLDDNGVIFTESLAYIIYIEELHRISRACFKVASERRREEDDLLTLEGRILLKELLAEISLVLLVKEDIGSRDTCRNNIFSADTEAL